MLSLVQHKQLSNLLKLQLENAGSLFYYENKKKNLHVEMI